MTRVYTIFGTGRHYSVISFVAEIFELDYWSATKKLIVDFQLDVTRYTIPKMLGPPKRKERIRIELVSSNKPKSIITYFDRVEYDKKPNDNYSLACIKNRITEKEFSRYKNLEEIEVEILKGKTCIPSAIKGNANENWKMQQMFLIDFDNKISNEDILINDSRHITEKQILKYSEEIGLVPTIIYNTFSHTSQQHRFRLIYILNEPITNIEVAKEIPIYLLEKFKLFNPDTSKKNLSDMYFGGINIYYSGANYYSVKEVK